MVIKWNGHWTALQISDELKDSWTWSWYWRNNEFDQYTGTNHYDYGMRVLQSLFHHQQLGLLSFTIVVNRSKKKCSILCGHFNPNHSCFDLQILMKCQMSYDFFILITRSVMQKKHELSVASCFMRIVLFLYFVAPQITYVYREWPCFWLNSMRGANRIHFIQNKGRFPMRYKVLSLIPLL